MFTTPPELQEEAFNQMGVIDDFRLLGVPDPVSENSNLDFDELFKKPQIPQLRKLASFTCLPDPVKPMNTNQMIRLEEGNRKSKSQHQTQLQIPVSPETKISPASLKTPEPKIHNEDQNKITPDQKVKKAYFQTPSPYSISLRAPRQDKKPVKFALSDESNQSPTTGSVRSGGPLVGFPCHCTKTQCLKLYCSCFHNNRLCTSACICSDCHNNQPHLDQRKDAIDFVRSKGVRAHEIDKFDTSQVWGCKCRKTHCLKRYCECYIRGKKCTSHCKCDGCENRRVPQTKKKIRHHIKVEKLKL